jgi:hypothetical protein
MNKLIGMVAAAIALTACGSSTTTQYLINFDNQYSITKGLNAKCNAADPQNNVFSTTLKSDSIISLYQGDDTNYYLDIGGRVVAGKQNGSAYQLTDSTTKVDSNDNNRVISSSNVVTVSMTQSNSLVSGTWTLETHEECNGNDCSTPEKQPTDCIYKTNFRGRQLPNDGTLAAAGQPGGNSAPSP